MIQFLEIFSNVLLFFICIWFGNFITSFYYRIPKNIPLNGKTHPPMCSTCGVKLKYPDYGPVYYYIFKGKFCKVCGAKIPQEYFFIELFTAIACMVVIFTHGISEKSFMMLFVLLAYILAFLINLKNERIPEKAMWIVYFTSTVYFAYNFKFETSFLFLLVTRLIVGFIFAFCLEKIIFRKKLPEGYIAMFAVLSVIQTYGLTVFIFTIIAIIAIFFKKIINIKMVMYQSIVAFAVFLIFDLSTPYLTL